MKLKDKFNFGKKLVAFAMTGLIAISGLVPWVGGVTEVKAADNWVKLATPPEEIREGHKFSEIVGNKIYVFESSQGKPAYVYDMDTDTWSTMVTKRMTSIGSTVVKDNIIYSFEGTRKISAYNTVNDTYVEVCNAPALEQGTSVVLVGNKIYSIGGVYGSASKKAKAYDIDTDSWSAIKDVPTARAETIAEAVGDTIYVMGGYSVPTGTFYNTVEAYNTVTDQWKTCTPTPARMYASYVDFTTVVGDEIYCKAVGGSNIYAYNTVTDNWSLKTSLPEEIGQINTLTSYGDTLYAIGYTVENKTVIYRLGDGPDTKPEPEVEILSVLLEVGEKIQLSASDDLSENASFDWSSNDVGIATVDGNGMITAVAVGQTKVYARNAEGFEEYINVMVIEKGNTEKRLAVDLKTGESAKLFISSKPGIIWTSLTSAVTVDTNGKITAVGPAPSLGLVQAEIDGNIQQIYVRVR